MNLRMLQTVLSAFPADTAQERSNLAEWTRAVRMGIDALTYRAGIERARQACGG